MKSGSRPHGEVTKYPEDSIQFFAGRWWEQIEPRALERGRFIWTFVAYPEPSPLRLTPKGRDDSRDHHHAIVKIEPHRIGDPLTQDLDTLPAAALPVREGEAYFVSRGKIRPALVVSTGGTQVRRELVGRAAAWQVNRTALVAPYYGVEGDGTRGGWPEEFVKRIRRAEYPQYVWDILPGSRSEQGSIVRLDHLLPVSQHQEAYRLTEYRLSEEALGYVDDWLSWCLTGQLAEKSALAYLREELRRL